jgi:hypothetical protein
MNLTVITGIIELINNIIKLIKEINVPPKKKLTKIVGLLFAVALVIVALVILQTPQTLPQTPPERPEYGTVPKATHKPEEPPPPDRFYRVVYMKNGAEGSEPVPGEARAGADVTVKSGDSLSKWRSVFAGWKSDTGTYYNAGDTINNISENITLTAQWKPIQPRDETKKIMTGETHSFFSGEVQLHFARTRTKNASPEGAIPVYTYVVDGWVSAGGKRKPLAEFEGGRTDVFSEAFDILVTDIQQYSAEFNVRKYMP